MYNNNNKNFNLFSNTMPTSKWVSASRFVGACLNHGLGMDVLRGSESMLSCRSWSN